MHPRLYDCWEFNILEQKTALCFSSYFYLFNVFYYYFSLIKIRAEILKNRSTFKNFKSKIKMLQFCDFENRSQACLSLNTKARTKPTKESLWLDQELYKTAIKMKVYNK